MKEEIVKGIVDTKDMYLSGLLSLFYSTPITKII
jgi:hypothetical protein